MADEMRGPVRYLAEHPAVHRAALAGAGFAVVVLANRSRRSRGLRRLGWVALCVLEATVFIGILNVRRRSAAPN